MTDVFEWKTDFVTGNTLIDDEHKQLFQQVNELYELFSDTKKYHDQISEKIISLKTILIKHLYEENELFEKYNISEKEEHLKAHTDLIKIINEFENYNFSSLLVALLLCDTIINYFSEHFSKYDKKFILELNKKMSIKT
ncbi:MAG TPA: hypothetical protein DDW90_09140 [Cyanobacteria bacterium UBA9971]|nr:hypothetical protein [Cyanobacteria bacterium UBA9971]